MLLVRPNVGFHLREFAQTRTDKTIERQGILQSRLLAANDQ